MNGDSPSDLTTTTTYAVYVEEYHQSLLLQSKYRLEDLIPKLGSGNPDATHDIDTPYDNYEDVTVDEAFFGTGYLIDSFPSLYDMYGKFMAGLDVDTLWTQTMADTVENPAVNNLIAAEADLMDDDIETNSVPRLQTGMRDINSVMSSSFVIGKSVIEDGRVKAIAKFAADIKYRLIQIASGRWTTHLEWNQRVVGVYAELMKFYFSSKADVDEINTTFAVKKALWPFTVLDFYRANVAAMQGATVQKKDVAGASTTQKILSGALSGAAMGAQVGSAWNTPAVVNAAGETTKAASSAGSGWGAGIGAVFNAAAMATY